MTVPSGKSRPAHSLLTRSRDILVRDWLSEAADGRGYRDVHLFCRDGAVSWSALLFPRRHFPVLHRALEDARLDVRCDGRAAVLVPDFSVDTVARLLALLALGRVELDTREELATLRELLRLLGADADAFSDAAGVRTVGAKAKIIVVDLEESSEFQALTQKISQKGQKARKRKKPEELLHPSVENCHKKPTSDRRIDENCGEIEENGGNVDALDSNQCDAGESANIDIGASSDPGGQYNGAAVADTEKGRDSQESELQVTVQERNDVDIPDGGGTDNGTPVRSDGDETDVAESMLLTEENFDAELIFNSDDHIHGDEVASKSSQINDGILETISKDTAISGQNSQLLDEDNADLVSAKEDCQNDSAKFVSLDRDNDAHIPDMEEEHSNYSFNFSEVAHTENNDDDMQMIKTAETQSSIVPSQIGFVQYELPSANKCRKTINCFLCSFSCREVNAALEHLCLAHFKNEIILNYAREDKGSKLCQHCEVSFLTREALLLHLGAFHARVLTLVPPNEAQGFFGQLDMAAIAAKAKSVNLKLALGIRCQVCHLMIDAKDDSNHFLDHVKRTISDGFVSIDGETSKLCPFCKKFMDEKLSKESLIEHLQEHGQAADFPLTRSFETVCEMRKEFRAFPIFFANSSKKGQCPVCLKMEADDESLSIHLSETHFVAFLLDGSPIIFREVSKEEITVTLQCKLCSWNRDSCLLVDALWEAQRALAIHLGTMHNKLKDFFPQQPRCSDSIQSAREKNAGLGQDVSQKLGEKTKLNVTRKHFSTLRKCPLCSMPCPSMIRLKHHLSQDHVSKDMEERLRGCSACPDCGRSFNSRAFLYAHYGAAHDKVLDFFDFLDEAPKEL